jgi:hypothetical protein
MPLLTYCRFEVDSRVTTQIPARKLQCGVYPKIGNLFLYSCRLRFGCLAFYTLVLFTKRAFWKVAVLYFSSFRLTKEAHAAYMRFCTSGA